MSWTAGYVLDIPYTSGFYRELAPTYLSFVGLTLGQRMPKLGDGATYCELACGQGVGTNLLAAANPAARFWGFDFNPAQIANARRLAAEAQLKNVVFEDYSFEQAADLPPDALPSFDAIVLHGIYSWISPENRAQIVRFIERRLKPGGLVYVSYNCMPGWAAMAPFQRLAREHANRNPDRSDIQTKAAIEFATKLRDSKALYFVQNPTAAARIERLGSQNANYLAHEYLNGHWHPLYHLDVCRELDDARLTYIGSATLPENIDAVSVPAEVQPMLANLRDRGWQETIRDFAANRQFRRDLFVRGAMQVAKAELGPTLAELRLVAMAQREDMTFKFKGPLGEITGREETYKPIADALCERPMSMLELAKQLDMVAKPSALIQAVAFLVHAGQVHPLREGGEQRASFAAAQKLNQVLAQRLRAGEMASYVAAPAIGGAVPASFVELIGLLAVHENTKAGVTEAARLGWNIMAATGWRASKAGQTLDSEQDNLAELQTMLTPFFAQKLPIWRRLGVV